MTAVRSVTGYFRTTSPTIHGGGRRTSATRRTLSPADLADWNKRGERSRAQYHGDGPVQRRTVEGAVAWLRATERAS